MPKHQSGQKNNALSTNDIIPKIPHSDPITIIKPPHDDSLPTLLQEVGSPPLYMEPMGPYAKRSHSSIWRSEVTPIQKEPQATEQVRVSPSPKH